MRSEWRCVSIALLISALAACSTTQSSAERETVSSASGGTATGGALAESVCQRSLELFSEYDISYVGGERSVPDACRSVRVDKTNQGLVATVFYHGNPVPWRFRVERGMGESKGEAYLPGLKKALEQSPKKVQHQRASDSIIVLESLVVDYYKGPGGGTFPSSIDDLTQLESVGAIPKDPWGNPYLYNTTGNRFTIVSPGPDSRTGTDDDVEADSDCVGGSRPCVEVVHVY